MTAAKYLDAEAIMDGLGHPIPDAERGILPADHHDDVLQIAGLQKLQNIRQHRLVAYWQERLRHVLGHQRIELLRQPAR